ncbi:tethering complex subunit [Coemansia interrupta]|uniref:Tethering complex subunit n=1 Tax=Coemansia interrupta TaxID=1126814 RepID=A0A9W8H9X1_9FUNG|nr:tethering complex subunit [Coemansia interrupta]
MSLLDDFAEYQSRTAHHSAAATTTAIASAGLGSSQAQPADLAVQDDGYITTTLDTTDAPIFSLDTVQFQVPNKIIALAVSNDILVLVIEGAKALRINLQHAHDIVEIDIPLNPQSLRACSLFLDPSGAHLLLSTPQGENFYCHESWDQMRPLSRFRNIELTAVAWNAPALASAASAAASLSSGTVLVGTHDGRIYETELRPSDDRKQKRSDAPMRLVAELPVRERITGLSLSAFPERRKHHLVLIATGTRLYQVVGAADIEPQAALATDRKTSVFEALLRDGLSVPNFQEIPGMPGPGALAVYRREVKAPGRLQAAAVVATDFAWLTSMGVFFGALTFAAQEAGDSVVENASLLPYPTLDRDASQDMPPEQPLALAVTEFHILLQYSDRIRAINMLNSKMVFEQQVSDGDVLQGLTVDEAKRTCWLFSPLNIYELVVTDEDRDIWDIYLMRRMYEEALGHCHNDSQRDVVRRAQAEQLFAAGQYEKSAECYALTTVGFEEAVLRFVDMKDKRVLRSYLVTKLGTFNKQERTQITLLVMWLIEIYLSMLGALDAKAAAAGAAYTENTQDQQQQQQPDLVVQCELEKDQMLKELYALVLEYKQYVHAPTAYQLAESHGRRDFWLHYASVCGDYQRVVEYWMEKGSYLQAIEVLGHYGTPEMFYKYSPALMHAEPASLVETLMRQPNLTANKLIPALMRYDEDGRAQKADGGNQAIRYLRFCIHKQNSRDPTVYNYYLTLLVKESAASDEGELMGFLTTYGTDMLYDPDYALRMCKRYGRIQSCVHLYSLLKLYEDAVDLALKHGDIELAQIHAERPADDDKLCKRLWLKIAQHVISQQAPASAVMELVRRSNRLGIEDILPYFPDFTRVDDFRDEICVALEDYEGQIQELRGEMDEAGRTAEAMQRDMQLLRRRFAVVGESEGCQVCQLPLWQRQFYVFPCQHAFHADCLTRRVVGTCNRVQRRRIQELQSQSVELARTRRQIKLKPMVRGGTAGGKEESEEQVEAQVRRNRAQMDALVAAECVLCGEAMIRTVGEPFGDDGDGDDGDGWAI